VSAAILSLVGLRRAAELLPPGSSLTIPREALLELVEGDPPPLLEPSGTPDRMLNAAEAAGLLCVAPRWLYRHAGSLPFTRRIGRKALRFSEQGLHRWLERQHGGLAVQASR
jgi:predicted DNA-binding transcriptional regulator AlpA